MTVLSVFIAGLLAVSATAAAVDYANVNLSDYLELCDRADPQRDECFKKSFNSVAQLYHKGEPSIGLRPFDPLVWKNLRFSFDNPIVLLSSLLIRNTKIVGLKHTKVTSVKTQFTDNEMRAMIDIEMPRIFIEGTYKGESRYTNIGYAPRGYFNMTAVDVTATITVAGSTEDRDGQSYMIMRQFDLKPEIGKLTTNFDGLFREPELNQVAVELVNNNWQAMYKVMVDQAKNIWEPFLLQQANAFFSVISYDKMFA